MSFVVATVLVATTLAVVAPAWAAGSGARVAPAGHAARFERVRDAVASGRLAPEVVRELRATGEVEAFLALDGGLTPSAAAERTVSAAELRLAYAPAKAAVLERLAGVRVVRDYDVLPLMLVRFSSGADLLAAANDPDVASVIENGTKELALSQSLPLIRQPTAAASGFIGTGTAVAVLDTGVNYTHPAFGSCTSPGVPAGCKVVVAQDFAPNDGSLDDNGHGTNVAGIVVGVAPGTKILALDVFGPGGTGSDADIIAGINFTIANKATYNVRAMNLSLGDGTHNTSTCSGSVYASAFSSARATGILPVVAAGNDAYLGGVFVNGISDPGCAPGAVSVGAVYDGNNGGLTWGAPPDTCTDATTTADQITCFSQSVSFLTVLGPGALITAAGITQGGTSQATPHVAGAVAVLAAKNPVATLDQITSAIANSGPIIIDGRNGVSKHRFDLPDAATAVGSPPPPPPPPTISSFSPTSGPPGTSVTIFGTNLSTASLVTFGGVGAAFGVVSDTQINATVPPGAPTGQIGVTTLGGTALSTGIFTVTAASADHARAVTFFRTSNRAKGKVTALDGFSACAAAVPLKLQEKRSRWITVATGSTSATGGFKATGLELQTRYRVVAPRKVLVSGDVCLKATSPTLLWL